MCFLKNRPNVADVACAHPGDVGNLFTHINMLSFWQFCRTLILTTRLHVGERLFLEHWLQDQRQANAVKRIPSSSRLVMGEHELECPVIAKGELDAAACVSTIENR